MDMFYTKVSVQFVDVDD